MSDVNVEISELSVMKYSSTRRGYTRLLNEHDVMDFLKESPHIPNTQSYSEKNGQIKIVMDYIAGKSLRNILDSSEGYDFDPLPLSKAKVYLKKYIDVEMDLLNRGVMYRDLNLNHIIFDDKLAYLVDLEASVIKDNYGVWRQNDMRGTWETMAPEEFPIYSLLTTRTATYRTAVVAHLLLSGKLPFQRFVDSRARSHSWRKQHIPKINPSLPRPVRKVLQASLSVQPSRRHKDPASLLAALDEASKDK